MSPVWIVGVLAILPALRLLGIVAALYAIYLLYLGLPRVMKAQQEKAAGLMGIASLMGVQGERETDDRKESTRKEGTRLVHEEVSRKGGRNKYSVVLADRYVVSARGGEVDIAALKSAVGGLDLARLESLK